MGKKNQISYLFASLITFNEITTKWQIYAVLQAYLHQQNCLLLLLELNLLRTVSTEHELFAHICTQNIHKDE